MIGRKGVAIGTVHGQHPDHAIQSFEWHRERRAQGGESRGIAHISGFGFGIAIEDWLAFFRDPAAQTFSQANRQRREQPEVVAAHQFGHQFAAL